MTLIGIGVWLMIAANDWLGLGYARSWPMLFIAIGLGTLVESLADVAYRLDVQTGKFTFVSAAAREVFRQLEGFAAYGFCKAHAACFAVVS